MLFVFAAFASPESFSELQFFGFPSFFFVLDCNLLLCVCYTYAALQLGIRVCFFLFTEFI